jgi:hypothetical protein
MRDNLNIKLQLWLMAAQTRMGLIGHWIAHNIFSILDVVKFLGILILVLMFIRFSVTVADNTRTAKENTATTQRIVKSQGDILEAIKQLALDGKVTSEQKTNIIICMLLVPVENRSTDVVTGCRNQVETGTPSPAVEAARNTIPQPVVAPTPTQTILPAPSPSLYQRILRGLGIKNKVKDNNSKKK